MEDYITTYIASPNGIQECQPLNYTAWGDDRSYRESEVLGYTNKTQAGISLGHDNALTFSPVWRAVSMISGDVARLPLHLYERTTDDRVERAKKHPHYKLFRRKPNDRDTAYRFWRQRMVEVLLWGASYTFLQRDMKGNIIRALPLLPDRTWSEDGGGTFFTVSDNKTMAIDGYDMLYLEWLGYGDQPIDVVKSARETWAAGLAAVGFTAQFLGRGGRLGGILEMPAGMSQTAIAKVEEGFRKTYESQSSAFATIVLRENAKFHSAQSTMIDAQMIEGRRESVRDVARFYGMAPSRLGEESGSSYNSKAEDNRDYLDTTLAPFLTMITSELIDKTLRDSESWPTGNSPELYWEHNTNDFLRMDAESRFRTYAVAIQSRIMSPNEARRAENMNPRPGGDTYENPNTSSPASQQSARAALAKILDDQVRKFAEARFDRLIRKSKDSRAFQAAAEVDASEDFRQSVKHVLDAVEAVTGDNLGAEVLEAYEAAVENRIVWVLDHVPAAALATELPRVRDAALDDITQQIAKLIIGDNEDADTE